MKIDWLWWRRRKGGSINGALSSSKISPPSLITNDGHNSTRSTGGSSNALDANHHQFCRTITPIVNGNGLLNESHYTNTTANGQLNMSGSNRPPSSMMTVDDMNNSSRHCALNSILVERDSNRLNNLNGTSNVNGHHADTSGQFCRTAANRMSLPIMQHNKLRRQTYNQLQRRSQHQAFARSLGLIYLQHKGETKQATLPNELTTLDTIRALFVCAFPRMLTMEYMSQPFVKIYIYNPSCNIFYELCDIDDVKHESVLRIHHSDPFAPLNVLPPHHMAQPVSQMLPPAPQSFVQPQAQQHYATIHRMPPRMQPQVPPPPPPPPLAPIMTPNNHYQQQQQQQQQMMTQQPLRTSTPTHQHGLQHPPPPIPQLPPPKPRRMIPASYSMHRLNPPQV